jgi:hypothetical protein
MKENNGCSNELDLVSNVLLSFLRESKIVLILSSVALIQENKGCNRLLDFDSKLVRNTESESSLPAECKSFVVSSDIDL